MTFADHLIILCRRAKLKMPAATAHDHGKAEADSQRGETGGWVSRHNPAELTDREAVTPWGD